MKVLAAMSGGVDSAVAAARAIEAGHDVTGVHLALSKNPQSFRSGARGCCSAEDAHDARRAADVLGIPFYIWDLSDRFAADVVSDFVAEYAAEPLPTLQREDQVLGCSGPRRRARFRCGLHRSLRPTKPQRRGCRAASRR
jgi:diphthamide synthase (EF-2-diphthine--ammonia ligase)